MTVFRWLLALGLVLGFTTSGRAEIVSRSPVFVVNLAEPDKGFSVVSARTFNDAIGSGTAGDWARDDATQNALASGRDPDSRLSIKTATPLERVLGACKSTDGKVAPAVRPIVERLYACVSCLNAYRETRFQTEAGDHVVLLVLYDANRITPDQIRPVFRESPRSSELVATARALAALFRKESQVAPEPSCESFVYSLQRQRSRLTVAVPVPEDVRAAAARPSAPAPVALISPVAAPAGAAAPAAAAAVLTSPEVTLGPGERWFFSADFSIAATKNLGLGKTPVADEKTLKSKDFFVALNFAFGDLLPDRNARLQRRGFARELLMKLQVTPSREPWESWAVGLGVRGYRLKTILWNMDVVHPYFTVGRQRVEGQTDAEAQAKWRAVFGLGFDPRSLGGDK
jgi:hypothetical protein